MKEQIKQVKASTLVLDYDLYPRDEINSYNVSQICRALEAGTAMPPMIAEKGSRRVADGFHRLRAYQRVFGLDCKVPVIFRQYPDEKALFMEAISLNASHGRQLSRYDRARCLVKGEGLGIAEAEIAGVLNMTLPRLTEMKVERFGVFENKPVVLKRMTAHLRGGDLTEEQQAFNLKAGGMNQTFYLNQIISMVEADAVDWDNEKVVNALKRLHKVLEEKLGVKV